MDTTLIYRKTPEGESALSGRSRLPDQRLRAVLILVDGETTMGRLCAKFDDKFQAGEKIERLEQLGLIEAVREPTPEARDGAAARSSAPTEPEARTPVIGDGDDVAVAAPAEATAIEAKSAPVAENEGSLRPKPASLEVLSQIGPAAADPVEDIPELPEYRADAAEPVVETLEAPELPGEVLFREQKFYPEFSHYDTPEIPIARPKLGSTLFTKLAAWNEQRKHRRNREPQPAAGAQIKESVPPKEVAEEKAAVSKKKRDARRKKAARAKDEAAAPGRKAEASSIKSSAFRKEPEVVSNSAAKRPSRRIPWIRGIALLLVVAALALYFAIPWDKYRAEAEARASALIGQPVSIGSMGPALFPYPHVVLGKVSVGADPVARAARVRLTPTLHSPGDGRHWALDVVVENASLEKDAVGAVCAATRLDSAAALRARVHAIRFDGLSLALPGTQIDGLNGEIGIEAGAASPRVTLANAADTLHVELFPQAGGCRFTAESPRWALPVGSDIALDGLNARGSFDATSGRLERFDARSADGVVGGSGTLTWGQGARLELALEVDHLRLEKALALVGRPIVARGQLDGKLRLTAASASVQDLGSALAGSGAMVVGNGAIDRFNVVEATRNPGKTAVYGGAFEFERLTTELQFGRGSASLRAVSASAGALQVGGEITIGKSNEIRGSLQSSISNGARNLQVPLKIGGSLASPELSAPANRVAAAPVAASKSEETPAGPQ